MYGGEITASLATSAVEGPTKFFETLISGFISGGATIAIDEAIEVAKGDYLAKTSDPEFRSSLVRDFIQGAAAGAVADAFGGEGQQSLAIFNALDTGFNDGLALYSQIENGEITSNKQLIFKLVGAAFDIGLSAAISDKLESQRVKKQISASAASAAEDIATNPNSPAGQFLRVLFTDSVSALLGVTSGAAPKAVTDGLAGP